jgi:hypothetical protein
LKRILSITFAFTLISISGTTQVINLSGKWRFQVGDKPSWSAAKYDDSNWEVIQAPSSWEDEGFNGYDGFAWYRKKFDGRLLSKEDNYYLNMGYIDDCDEIYINGTLIGFSGSMPPKFKTAFNAERKYTIPNDIIDYKGENTIAIRVFDVTITGGIVDGRLGIYKSSKNRMLVDLNGLWNFRTSDDWEPIKDDKGWSKIMVPSPWEQQGYSHYDGFAWYKRTFTITASIADKEELVLVLGKIDDFDKTYLNGKVIGKTNDRKVYLQSRSFDERRVYVIPANVLIKNGTNTIEVLVEDIGDRGGIYEGPIGIMTKSSYEWYYD